MNAKASELKIALMSQIFVNVWQVLTHLFNLLPTYLSVHPDVLIKGSSYSSSFGNQPNKATLPLRSLSVSYKMKQRQGDCTTLYSRYDYQLVGIISAYRILVKK